MLYIVVFILSCILDVVWAEYIIHVNKQQPFQSAVWNSGIVLTNSIVVILYVSDPYAILANVAGGFVGTYLIVRWQRERKVQ